MTIEILTKEQIVDRCRTAGMSAVGLTRDRKQLIKDAEQLSGGYYVTECDAVPEILEGPYDNEAYARHRAQTVHGMPREGGEEIAEDELPW